jgi:hypothetical protein
MQKTKEAAFTAFYIFIAVYSVVLLIGGITNIVYAQEAHNYRLENLEKRVTDFEELKLDQRVTRVETILNRVEMILTSLDSEHTNWLNYAGNSGIGLLLARALYLDIRKRRGIE